MLAGSRWAAADYGLGNCANNLKLGCDCLGNIHYFPAWLNNNKGEPLQQRAEGWLFCAGSV
jgi:Cu2+-containing amine oxidase